MSSSGKQAKHASGICCVARLAEYLSPNDDYRVCTYYEGVWLMVGRSQGLLPGQAFGTIAPAFSRLWQFGDVGRMNGEGNTGVAQQFLAAWRGGGEHERRSLTQ